jgi:hypothetical protein
MKFISIFLALFGSVSVHGRLLDTASSETITTGTVMPIVAVSSVTNTTNTTNTTNATITTTNLTGTPTNVTSTTANVTTIMTNVTNTTTNGTATNSTPGGYTDIPNLNDKYVQQAAAYAVQELVKSNFYSQYPFLYKLQRPNAQYTRKVVRGKQQVVAGMNYKLNIKLLKPNGRCLGGLHVIVYDQFGSLSVIKWGKKARCMRLM